MQAHTKAIALLSSLLMSSPIGAFAQTWWDTSYGARIPVRVTTSASTPDKGYKDYTARIPSVNTASLISAGTLQSDCDDLRLIYWNGTANTEIPRHLIDCNNANSDIRFAIQSAQAASSTDAGYYIYYGNPLAPAPPALTPTNVYLWFDDATTNRLSNYTQGRGDLWLGSGHRSSFRYDTNGYYTYDTGDNNIDSFRIPVDERDVYTEAEFYHTGCYPFNISSGMIVRGIITSGNTAASESSNHYYASVRAQSDGCRINTYTWDGDIVQGSLSSRAVDAVDPGVVAQNTWRRQGLAAWGINDTNLKYYDDNATANWTALGYPGANTLQAAGTDNNDSEGRGFAGIMTNQDRGRVRNILIRRYIEDEPSITFGPREFLFVDLITTKTLRQPTNTTIVATGDTVIFRLSVKNTSTQFAFDNIALTDKLPDGLTYSSDSSSGDYNATTGVWNLGTIPPNTTVSLDITATVDTNTLGDTITNKATAANTPSQSDTTTTGDVLEASVIVANPNLSVIKTHSFLSDQNGDERAAVGDIIRYTYTITNQGNVAITNIKVTDVATGKGDKPNDGVAPDIIHATSGALTDIAPLGDSMDSDGANNIWTDLGPKDTVVFTWDYTVVQGDVDLLQ